MSVMLLWSPSKKGRLDRNPHIRPPSKRLAVREGDVETGGIAFNAVVGHGHRLAWSVIDTHALQLCENWTLKLLCWQPSGGAWCDWRFMGLYGT
jgi:hypothetical protein